MTQEPLIHFNVITMFPECFPGSLGISVLGRALKNNIWSLKTIDLKNFSINGRVDDKPFGGGPGMLFKPDVLGNCIDEVIKDNPGTKLIYLSASGTKFIQASAKQLIIANNITMICGRFEGIDYRAIKVYDLEELSVGDFVLSGGEVAAMVVIDCCVRLLPGVLQNSESMVCESFTDTCKLEHPQYTRPFTWKGLEVPVVLRSGNHKEIEEWRRCKSEAMVKKNRPDLEE